MKRIGIVALVIAAIAACGDPDPAAPPSNGVNDVRKACEIRSAWTDRTSSRCIDCIAAAANPPCACPERPAAAGRCESQQAQRSRASFSCDGVEECRFRCPSNDCACVDACYAQKDACRAAASALDGCVTEACADLCDGR